MLPAAPGNMKYLAAFFPLAALFSLAKGQNDCVSECVDVPQTMICGFNEKEIMYKMFPSKCALECSESAYNATDLEFCIKHHNTQTRKMYGESCPAFCPSHYRPVCGASKFRSYVYRAFNNGCYLDMLNCRGEDEMFGYVEVPLDFCQRHAMKNIFAEQVVISGLQNFREYD